MKNPISLTVIILLLAVCSLSAATHYVSLGSTNPTPPYTNWATAATSIQAAMNVAATKDAVLVTDGVYPGGVSVTKALTLLSVNGPQFTIINGGGTSQCVSLTNGASLTGFTLTNGYSVGSGVGGGVACASTNAFLTNCLIVGNSAYSYGGGASRGTLYNCTLSGNWVPYGSGGGANGCGLYNCTLSGNGAHEAGGGACVCTLYNCTLSDNGADWSGGGADGCTLYNCTLTGNSASMLGDGGGANSCTLYNCTLSGNSASNGHGGGANSCTLHNCTLHVNTADFQGGGTDSCTLYNCTLSGNTAGSQGGGANGCTLYNCIVYYNTAVSGELNYDSSSTLNYCCTTPLPTAGVGNLALDPQLASATYLSAGSPCRGAGSAGYATGTDIDGEPWGNPPSIGCDEYHAGAVTGPLTVGILASPTNVPAGYAVSLTALIEGRTTQSAWDFGDGVVVSNRPYASHAWTAPGDYAVALRAYNEANVAGVSATVTIHVIGQPVLYVAASSPNPQPPYASWATAARNIQDAVNAADSAGATVLVTNGVYPGGVQVTKPLTLRSVSGPQFTSINGGGRSRCVSLTGGASLTGLTLTNGYNTSQYDVGGGVACASTNAFLTNCLIVGNSSASSGYGGGAYGGTFYNCTLSGNSIPYDGNGGGAYGGALYNCTLIGNSASTGGGAYSCTLYNCIVYYNTASGGANYDSSSTLNYCCTTPLPTAGVGNISKEGPLFVDSASGNLRLQSNSPCINAGNNAYVTTTTDLDGRPRIVGGTVDMGAYEFQPGVSGAFIGWLLGYGLPTDGSADYADSDQDGMSNWQEWVCGTNPTNRLSVLRLLSPSITGTKVTLTWQGVADVNYHLERSANPAAPFTLLATNILGQAGTTIYADTNATGAGPVFYRVGVKSP